MGVGRESKVNPKHLQLRTKCSVPWKQSGWCRDQVHPENVVNVHLVKVRHLGTVC